MAAKTLSIADLEREIARRKSALTSLEAKHKSLLGQLKDVESEIAAIRGTGGGSGRKRGPGRPRGTGRPAGAGRPRKTTGARSKGSRGKNKLTLPDAIAAAMDVGAVVSPKEAAEFVKANGYKTKSKTFGIQVATTLSKDARFKRVGRGQYERIK
jgi:hypothetical protein